MTILTTATIKKAFPFLLLSASILEDSSHHTNAFQIGTGIGHGGLHQHHLNQPSSSSTSSSSSSTTPKAPPTAFTLGNHNNINNIHNINRRLVSAYSYSSYSTDLHYIQRDADFGEILAGGQRYEMVELPDSMLDTTIFVGNLCEFVTDDMLSSLFQQVSTLNFVPACVARKPNMSSLKYGFVTFPTVSEKEAAIIKFTGYVLNNKVMKVEEIQDFDKVKRVRVPEKLVVYAVGEVKRTREGKRNTMRRVTNSRESDGRDRDRDVPSNNTISTSKNSRSSSRSRNSGSRSRSISSAAASSGLSSLLSSTSSMSSSYSKDGKRGRRRHNKKRSQMSSSSMLGGGSGNGGYKNMKRREKRKNRRMKNNNNSDDFGLNGMI